MLHLCLSWRKDVAYFFFYFLMFNRLCFVPDFSFVGIQVQSSFFVFVFNDERAKSCRVCCPGTCSYALLGPYFCRNSKSHDCILLRLYIFIIRSADFFLFEMMMFVEDRSVNQWKERISLREKVSKVREKRESRHGFRTILWICPPIISTSYVRRKYSNRIIPHGFESSVNPWNWNSSWLFVLAHSKGTIGE